MNLEQLAQTSQIVGAVIFLVVAVWIWNRYIAPGVKSYQAAKNAELAEAEGRREAMRGDIAAARGEVEAADGDARMIRERIGVVTQRERDRAIAEAEAEAERVIRNAEGELDRARMAARDRLRIELIEKALVKARAEAVTRLDPATNSTLVSTTIDDLTRGRG